MSDIRTVLSKLIIDPSGCVLWTGAINRGGYGNVRIDGRTEHVHRLMYSLFAGPIPDGMQIDHLCRVRHCANVSHLEVVTPRENVLRSTSFAAAHARKTHCPQGHPYDEANTYTSAQNERSCRTCHRISDKRRYDARKAAS